MGRELMEVLEQLERRVAHRKGAAAGVSRAVVERLQSTQEAIAALRQEIGNNPGQNQWNEPLAQLLKRLPPAEAAYLSKFLERLNTPVAEPD